MTKRRKNNRGLLGFVIGIFFTITVSHAYRDWKVQAMYDPYVTTVKGEVVFPKQEFKPLPKNVEETIRWAFADKGEKVVTEALLVARCESGLKADAYNGKNKNGSNDAGVFQVNSVHGVPQKFLKDYRTNIMIARKIYEDWGNSWGAWVCARKVGLVK